MGSGTGHLGRNQYILTFSFGTFSLMLAASSSLPSLATELGNRAENAAFSWGFTVIWEDFLEEEALLNTEVLLTRVLQQALGTAILAWKYLRCVFPFQGLSIP